VARKARLSRSCRYRKAVVIKSTRRLRTSEGRLRVIASFGGNGVLSGRRAKPRTVRFG
jgi:hypothetical protein